MGEAQEYNFYIDSDTEGSVFAVSKGLKRSDGMVEGFASTYDRPNSPVSWTAIHPALLGEQISKDEARKIHPRLFDRLDIENS